MHSCYKDILLVSDRLTK